MLENKPQRTLSVSPAPAEKSAPRGYSYVQFMQVFVITASLLMITLSVNLQVPLYKAYAQPAGYGNGFVAVAFAAYVVGLLPVLIMFGGVSDRIGRKPVMLLGLFFALLANVFIIVDPSMHMLLKVRILQGVAVGLSLGAATAYLAEILENSTHVANIAGIVVTLGLGSGSLITSASLLYEYSNVPYSYFGVATAIVFCVAVMSFMPNTQGMPSKGLIRLPYVSKKTINYCFAIFLAWSLTGGIIATIPGELERLHLEGWSGVLVFLAICTGALFQPWARRLGADLSLIAGYIMLALGYFLLLAGVWFGSLGLILVASACSGASSFGFIYLGGLAAVVRSSGHEKARAVSGYFLFAYLGLGLPCILIGYSADEAGLFTALVRFGGALAGLIAIFMLYRLKVKDTVRVHATDTVNHSKEDIIKNEQLRMEQELVGGNWSLKQKMALTCRILYAHGHGAGLSGQITARAEAGTFITQRLGCGLDEVTASNLLSVDEDLNVLAGKGMPNPANRFHAWIYRARPDVNCIIHTHPLYTSALSMLEEPLQVSHMDACVLFEDIAFLPDWPGVPVGNDEGEMIAEAIQDKRALLLAHHGLVVVSASVEEACVLAVQFERAAQLHMIAAAVGGIREIDPELGREAHDWILHERRSAATFSYYARQAIKQDPSCLS